MTNQSQEPDRGTPTPPTPGGGPKPATGDESMQDFAPPRDVPTEELLGEDEASRSGGEPRVSKED